METDYRLSWGTSSPRNGAEWCMNCVKYSCLAGTVIYFSICIISLISKTEEYKNCQAPMNFWLVVEFIMILLFIVRFWNHS